MAVRRKKAQDGDNASLDSLMDALTNVVAVLIFVLLLVNCEVAQKVVKMMEDLVPVTEEQIRQVQEMLKQIDIDKQKMEELLKQPKPSQVDFDELQKAIELLQKQKEEKLKQNNERSAAQAELKKLHDETLAARDEEQKKNIAMQEEIRRLEILLDTTPVEKDIPPTEITIPATRPIPEGAKTYYAYVVHDKVFFVDPYPVEEYFTELVDELEKDKDNHFTAAKPEDGEGEKKLTAAERRAQREKEKAEAKLDKPITLDRHKIWEKFTGTPPPHPPGAPPAAWGVSLPPQLLAKLKVPPGQSIGIGAHQVWWGMVRATWYFSPTEGGTTIEELKQPINSFSNALSKIRPPKEVLIFKVHPPSMYAYALAREIADKKGIPCGWEVTDIPEHRIDSFAGLSINPVGEFKLDPNAPPPPERPRGTGAKLD